MRPFPFRRNFVRKAFLNQHIKVVHEGVMFKCEICNQRLTSKQKLAIHQANHESKSKETKKKAPTKSRAKRKDQGTQKKAMATLLSTVNVGKDGEKRLLKDEVVPIAAEDIAQDILEQPELLEDFLNSDKEFDETMAAGQICQKEFCNEQRVSSANVKGILKSAKTVVKITGI
jgi:hypothetical protein